MAKRARAHEWQNTRKPCVQRCRHCGVTRTVHALKEELGPGFVAEYLVCSRCGLREPNRCGPHRPPTEDARLILADKVREFSDRAEICSWTIRGGSKVWFPLEELPAVLADLFNRAEDQVAWLLEELDWPPGGETNPDT